MNLRNLLQLRRSPVVVAATANADALKALWSQMGIVVREARTPDGINAHLGQAQLVILDARDLQPAGLELECVQQVLRQSQVPCASSAAFLDDPARWLNAARAFSGSLRSLPPRLVAFTALSSGGVGKTTLSLATALAFARQTGLPAAVLELSQATSGLMLALDGRHFAAPPADAYAVATQGAQAGVWLAGKARLTVLPMAGDTAHLLQNDQMAALLATLRAHHVLTVVDAGRPHPLWPAVQQAADHVFVVAASGRPDTLANARLVSQELRAEDGSAPRFTLVINRAGRLDGIAAGLVKELPYVTIPDRQSVARFGRDDSLRRLLISVWPGAAL